MDLTYYPDRPVSYYEDCLVAVMAAIKKRGVLMMRNWAIMGAIAIIAEILMSVFTDRYLVWFGFIRLWIVGVVMLVVALLAPVVMPITKRNLVQLCEANLERARREQPDGVPLAAPPTDQQDTDQDNAAPADPPPAPQE